MQPGSIVRCRNRDWVLLPSASDEVYLLRPLTGLSEEVVAVHRGLSDLVGYSLPEERVRPAAFPLPTPDDLSDAASAHLLWQAARLTLRESASPFRSFGKISIRPRIFQFVPLLMALRLDPVRLLIADDVGVGKTIEALLIARELFDRGEIRNICVLCPPYLCDQWQKDLAKKFNLDPVVIRSGTVNQLERQKPQNVSIYRHFPVQVISIDFIKSDRNKHLFLLDCPDLVIVDEAHGSAIASERNTSQHQRHQLVADVAAKSDRHLILLTATPHSGFESAFRSLVAFLKPEFGEWDTSNLSEPQRIELAQHFVQRTRRDIEQNWEGDQCFPQRQPSDETWRLSGEYRELFNRTFNFCTEMIRSGTGLDKRHQRVRSWAALALLRCVMSSPAAAIAALTNRSDPLPPGEENINSGSYIFESDTDRTDDESPTPPIETAEATISDSDKRRLRELGRMAEAIRLTPADTKLSRCIELVDGLLQEGFHPIVWCRYIATAEYLETGLWEALAPKYPDLRVTAITSRTGDDEERASKLVELAQSNRRVLVATDCLSEGINLQDSFSAVLHYDLPWNPNRLEQREGRVDRYGRIGVVKAIRFFGADNPVDGAVLDVLLNKALEIHRSLGTYVPVPEESESVTEAVLQALFLRGRPEPEGGPAQMALNLGLPEVQSLHQRWERDKERERINRTRFAQRALKPEEVRAEMEKVDSILGDPDAVRDFVLNASQRIGLPISQDKRKDVFRISTSQAVRAALPEAISFILPDSKSGFWLISFNTPTPEGAEFLGRNHPFVAGMARFLMEEALSRGDAAIASRCGAIRTGAVSRLTTILLLRARYLVKIPERKPLLAEEILAAAFLDGRAPGEHSWLDDNEALRLLGEAKPDANIPMAEKRGLATLTLAKWPALESDLRIRLAARAADLESAHKRVRQAVSLRIRELSLEPQFPPDLIGVLVLQPMVKS
jgi:superfamily II DNA or RNA helicase